MEDWFGILVADPYSWLLELIHEAVGAETSGIEKPGTEAEGTEAPDTTAVVIETDSR